MLRLAFVAAVAALTFWLGYFARGFSRHTEISQVPQLAPATPAVIEMPPVAAIPVIPEQVSLPVQEAPQPATSPTWIDSPETLLRRAISHPPGQERNSIWLTALNAVTKENWRKLFNMVSDARHQLQITADEEQWTLQRIGAVAQEEAAERFKPKDPVNEAETHTGRHAMRGWAEQDPSAAWRYIEAQSKGRFRDGMIWGYILGVAPRDTRKALEAIENLAPNHQEDFLKRVMERDQTVFYSGFVEAWLQCGPRGLTQPDGQTRDLRESVFREYVNARTREGWGDPNGQRFLTWMEQFRGAPFMSEKSIGAAAVHLLNKRSPEETMNWIEIFTHEAPATAQNATTEIMQRWTQKDTPGAMQWIESHRDSSIYDFALVSFLKAQQTLNRAQVLALLDTLQDSDNAKSLPRNIDTLIRNR